MVVMVVVVSYRKLYHPRSFFLLGCRNMYKWDMHIRSLTGCYVLSKGSYCRFLQGALISYLQRTSMFHFFSQIGFSDCMCLGSFITTISNSQYNSFVQFTSELLSKNRESVQTGYICKGQAIRNIFKNLTYFLTQRQAIFSQNRG